MRITLFVIRDAVLFVLAFVAAFFVSIADAQTAQGGHGPGAGPMARGNFLKPEQYSTQSALTLFVDGAQGNDGNTCTASGTSACATIGGAVNRIPKLIRHPVTVTIAAGNYTGANLYGYFWDAADTTAGAYISFVGSQQNFSPATGTATGTVTSVTTGYSSTAGSLTCIVDNTQTWTVDNLQSRFLNLTGGTGSGQVFPIYTNTATQICVTGIFSPLPIAGTTYAVQTPAVVVNTGVNQPRLVGISTATAGNPSGFNVYGSDTFRFSTSDSTIGFTDIDVSVSAASTRAFTVTRATIALLRVRAATTASSTSAVQVDSLGRLTSSQSSYVSSANTISLGRQQQVGVMANLSRTFIKGATGGILFGSADTGVNITLGGVVEVTSASAIGYAVSQGGSANGQIPGTTAVRCTGPAAASGTALSIDTAVSTGASPSFATFEHMVLDGCAIGAKFSGPAANAFFRNNTVQNNTTGLVANYGAQVLMGGAGMSFTGNGTDLSVDSSYTSTFAAFEALVPKAYADMNTGSRLYHDTSL